MGHIDLNLITLNIHLHNIKANSEVDPIHMYMPVSHLRNFYTLQRKYSEQYNNQNDLNYNNVKIHVGLHLGHVLIFSFYKILLMIN